MNNDIKYGILTLSDNLIPKNLHINIIFCNTKLKNYNSDL